MQRISCLVFIFLCCIAVLGVPITARLCVENSKTHEILRTFKLEDQEEFYVEFLHSVNRTLVREYYKIEKGQIHLFRAEYSSFGAGMPEVPEQEGATLKIENGILHLDGIDTTLPEFIYRVGTIANHTLFINGTSIPLNKIAPEQTGLRFQYRKVPLYILMRRFDTSNG